MQSRHRHDYFEPDTFGRAVQDGLGDDLMLKLRRTLGGRDIRIPRAGTMLLDDHVLVRAVGHDDARRLCDHFDGERVYIPAIRNRDDACIDAMHMGLSNAEIAERLMVTDRHVRRCLAARGLSNPNRRANVRRTERSHDTSVRRNSP